MGSRLQLAPNLTEADFDRWKLNPEARILARALQDYGMIVIDGGGHPKLLVEYEKTANWQGSINKKLVRKIPYTAFKLLHLKTPERLRSPVGLQAVKKPGKVTLKWQTVEWANRYRVLRRMARTTAAFAAIAKEITATVHEDGDIVPGQGYEYVVVAVNHNGVSQPSSSVSTVP